MADSEFGIFCTQWLLHDKCTRGNSCIFLHANSSDVKVLNELKDEKEFVRGIYMPNPNKFSSRSHNEKSQNPAQHMTNINGTGARRKVRTRSFSGINLPSTSSHNSASSSSRHGDSLRASGSHTGSKKKTKNQKGGNLPHTITSGAFDQIERQKLNNNNAKTSVDKRKPLSSTPIDNDEWVKAPEFIPRSVSSNLANLTLDDDKSKRKLCPYAERDGMCKYPPGECSYLHGNLCELCDRSVMHPYNEEQRKQHTQECIKQHERDMEISFAIARSKEKVCGICFEVIMQKTLVEQRFGILPNCNHCFCLACIRRWRQAKQFENKIIRACPECRVTSDFVCPSSYWVDTKEEKEKVIDNYKQVLSKKDCKYFKKGNGSCPFGNKCFYLHALNDGTKVDVGPPPSHRNNDLSDVEMIQRLLMLGFLHESLTDNLEFEDLINFVDFGFTDSEDDSMMSDCDYMDLLLE